MEQLKRGDGDGHCCKLEPSQVSKRVQLVDVQTIANAWDTHSFFGTIIKSS
jgi:hypothetical protein